MPIVTWSNDYLVKNQRINDHHKLFFELLNRFYDAVVDKNSSQDIEGMMAELENYATTHFVYEEIYMLDISYGYMKDHIAQHDIFRAKIKDLNRLCRDYTLEAKLDMVDFLKEWTLNHIIEEDQRLAQWKAVPRVTSN